MSIKRGKNPLPCNIKLKINDGTLLGKMFPWVFQTVYIIPARCVIYKNKNPTRTRYFPLIKVFISIIFETIIVTKRHVNILFT